MSSITTKTKTAYVAVVYNQDDEIITEGSEWYWFDQAVEDARELVAHCIEQIGAHYYAKIECRIIPLYE